MPVNNCKMRALKALAGLPAESEIAPGPTRVTAKTRQRMNGDEVSPLEGSSVTLVSAEGITRTSLSSRSEIQPFSGVALI